MSPLIMVISFFQPRTQNYVGPKAPLYNIYKIMDIQKNQFVNPNCLQLKNALNVQGKKQTKLNLYNGSL
jgi:hypothetical protein